MGVGMEMARLIFLAMEVVVMEVAGAIRNLLL
jgi:hypothetical protein